MYIMKDVSLSSVLRRLAVYTSVNKQMFACFKKKMSSYVPYEGDESSFSPDLLQVLIESLLDIHADEKTVLSAFLLCYRREASWDEDYGTEITALVDGVRNLMNLQFERLEMGSQRGEVLRKMLVALSKDVRGVLLYLMIQLVRLEHQCDSDMEMIVHHRHLATIIMHIFVPVAGRLGMYRLKRRLEDACFRYLYPVEYQALIASYKSRTELEDGRLDSIVDDLQNFFETQGIFCSVSGRVKGLYSTFTKMKRSQKYKLSDIYDLLAFRVIVDSPLDAYNAMGFMSSHYVTDNSRFKDYIAYPKINGYQSLHMVVYGIIAEDENIPVEVQIRTEQMHREAEYGIASHWWYEEEGIKQRSASVSGSNADTFTVQKSIADKLDWVSHLVQIHESLSKADEKNDLDFFSDRIFVLTLSNEVIDLPVGSTPVDFAYALGDEMGHKCFKVKVNGRIVSLDYELKSGDKVFVIPKMHAVPSPFWLSFVQTDKAKSKIKEWLIQNTDSDLELADSFKAVVEPDVSPVSYSKKKRPYLYVHGFSDLETRLATCCKPLEGDRVRGYVTRGGFISVHKKTCRALLALDRRRYIDVSWEHIEPEQKVFSSRLEITSKNPQVHKSLDVLLDEEGSSKTGLARYKTGGLYRFLYTIPFQSEAQREQVFEKLKAVSGVESIHFLT
jgi:(p)ppGpp synthase/HD superfamily hydrolase